jgi:energy-coupling factor transporter ATP-binding protein EcfA2
MKEKLEPPPAVREWYSQIGKLGGASTSPAKLADQAKLPVLSEIRGRELAALRAKFEELYPRKRGRLTAIHIKNYRAFNESFDLELPRGENAIIYGENGAGKSSLFHSIRDFLEAPQSEFLERDKPEAEGTKRELRLADNQHRPKTGEPTIQLQFEHGSFTWDLAEDSSRKSGPWDASISATNKAKGFLDYRALLRIHFLPGRDGARIDVFDLMIRQLLPHYTYYHADYWQEDRHGGLSGTGERSLAQGWSDVERRAMERHSSKPWTEFQAAQKAFDQALKQQVETQLAQMASEIAKRFDPELEIRFKVEASNYDCRPRKKLLPPRVYVHLPPSGERGQIIDYDRFFNEARLTAIAMSIFFAALLNSPATGQRILALDDILIGLDMSHRLTVLRILEHYFKGWQVLIFTYHKAWFEILKERTASKVWSHPWKSLVVRQEQVRDTKVSLVRHDESGLLLELANRYATRREYKSAAVHARTAMEIILSRFCARKRLPVSYVENRNRQTNHHFLNAIDLWLSRLRSPIRYATWVEIRNELDHSLRFVLHSYSHNSSEREDELEGEVVAAIKIVQQVEGFLTTLRQGELAAEKVSDEQRTFLWLIEDAITMPVSNRHEEALRSLSHATECFLLDELPKRGVIIRLSEDADLWRIFFRDAKLNRSEKILFASMRQYLGGNLKSNKFEVASFNAAVLLLLRMRLLSAAKAWLKLKK